MTEVFRAAPDECSRLPNSSAVAPAVEAGLGPSPGAGETRSIQIVIAAEHPIFRDGLRRLLEAAPTLRILADAPTSQARALMEQLNPDILLLGVARSGAMLPDVLPHILAGRTSVRLILLTPALATPEVVKMLRFRAHGVVPMDADAETLFRSIESVMEGHFWVGRERVANITAGVRRLDSARRRLNAFGLTSRELDILRAVMSGDTNKEIARRFSISLNTVKGHVTHIFDKVGASSRVELVLFAAHHQVLENS